MNKQSLKQIKKAKWKGPFLKPDKEYQFANIPLTIMKNFGISVPQSLPNSVFKTQKQTKKMVLFLLDGFGFNFFLRYRHQFPFLKKAWVSKLTTQFPSTTTANITTIHTGLPVGKTGVNEWFYYDPVLDDVYSPFMYKRARGEEAITTSPKDMLPNTNIYRTLSQQGVKPYVFQFGLFNQGPYSTYIHEGSQVVDFDSLEDGLSKLNLVLKEEETQYCYFYHADIDKLSHEFGPNSEECEKEILRTLTHLEHFLAQLTVTDTRIMITADHGQTTVIKDHAVYINRDIPEILPYLKTNLKGEYIVPCGSFRDMFLHIKEEHLQVAKTMLESKLKGKAEVYLIHDLIEEGFFGEVTDDFINRIGDLVILAYTDEAVWWYEENKLFVRHWGMHGGLVPEELEIPFIVIEKE